MIKLTISLTDAAIAEMADARLSDLNQALDFFESIKTVDLTKKLTLNATHAQDIATGEVYEDISIIVTARFTQGGHIWCVGEGIALSLTSMIETLENMKALLEG